MTTNCEENEWWESVTENETHELRWRIRRWKWGTCHEQLIIINTKVRNRWAVERRPLLSYCSSRQMAPQSSSGHRCQLLLLLILYLNKQIVVHSRASNWEGNPASKLLPDREVNVDHYWLIKLFGFRARPAWSHNSGIDDTCFLTSQPPRKSF